VKVYPNSGKLAASEPGRATSRRFEIRSFGGRSSNFHGDDLRTLGNFALRTLRKFSAVSAFQGLAREKQKRRVRREEPQSTRSDSQQGTV